MRGSWARFAPVIIVVAVLLVVVDTARVNSGVDPVSAAAPAVTAEPLAPPTATPAVRTPPPDPQLLAAVPTPGVPAEEVLAVVEPEVAGIAVTPVVPTASPTPTFPPTPTPAPTPTARPEVAISAAPPPVPPTPTPTSAPTTTVAPTPPPTPTPTPVNEPGALGQAALGLIGYPWASALPGWTIDFLGQESGLRGLTFTGEARIEIYVRPGDSAWDLARVVAHELGHAVDLVHNNVADREAWLDHRGITGTPWWPGSGASDFDSGAGDFAECFATWQVGSGSLSTGGPCDQSDLDLVASLS